MDERLRPEPLTDASVRSLLTQERVHRQELEQEVARLLAGVARQNAIIIRLEQENAVLRTELREVRLLLAAVREQNTLLCQQVASLQAENAELRGIERTPKAAAPVWPAGHATPKAEEKPRKKRNRRHNHGRARMTGVDERVQHAAEACPRCGTNLTGGTVHRRIQVIELPPPRHIIVTEHQLIARRCPVCARRVLPQVVIPERLGRSPFGPRLTATIAMMATVERLPKRQIQDRCKREYGLRLSLGGITALLARVAAAGAPAYAHLQVTVRGSPVVHMDETGWRQCGKLGYVWTASTHDTCYFHFDAHRTKEVADTVLDADFAGTLVTDFYPAYDHFDCPKQRCWAHLWRDIDALETEYPDDGALAAWVTGVRTIYDAARGPRPATEVGMHVDAMRAREQRARTCERQLLLLCPQDMPTTRPEATLAKRIRRYGTELFTFVADPAVPATNNAAERSLRALVVARKISGGTRSPAGTTTRMTLASLAATARLQGNDPAALFYDLLCTAPPTPTPSHTL